MGSFIGGVILTLAIVVPVAAILWRRQTRPPSSEQVRDSDTDSELSRLTGELAHEIKNPLSTVKVNLALAREALEDIDLVDVQGGVLEKSRHGLSSAVRKITVIQKEADRLEQIVDGFLKYVRRPDLQLATVDLNELVGDMIDFYSPQAASHALTLRHTLAPGPLMCRVDAGALKQAMLNVFINAQQASEGGGELMIRTSRCKNRGVLQISDTGRGIPADKLSMIFRPYYSSRAGGTGLGLPTAKKIIEAHNGTITVHSEVEKGTSFTIEIPLVAAEGTAGEVS